MSWWESLVAWPAAARSAEQELLDGDELDPQELRTNLREMAMLNRLPGGVGASIAGIRWATRGVERLHVLDAGTGSGHFPRRLRRALTDARVTAVDSHPEVLAIARHNLRGTDEVTLLHADVRALPVFDASLDVAHASLLLHHLEPDDVVATLAELRRVSRRGVVINDLRRGRVAVAVSSLTVLALARGRYTRHDGPMSARRAYSIPELDELAGRAGLAPAWRTPAFMPRVTTVYR